MKREITPGDVVYAAAHYGSQTKVRPAIVVEIQADRLYACWVFALSHMAAKSSLFRPIFSNRSAITVTSRSLSVGEVRPASCSALISSAD